MTSSELAECRERAVWLLDRRHLMPRDLVTKLDTWHADLVAETEDRVERERKSRERART